MYQTDDSIRSWNETREVMYQTDDSIRSWNETREVMYLFLFFRTVNTKTMQSLGGPMLSVNLDQISLKYDASNY